MDWDPESAIVTEHKEAEFQTSESYIEDLNDLTWICVCQPLPGGCQFWRGPGGSARLHHFHSACCALLPKNINKWSKNMSSTK